MNTRREVTNKLEEAGVDPEEISPFVLERLTERVDSVVIETGFWDIIDDVLAEAGRTGLIPQFEEEEEEGYR